MIKLYLISETAKLLKCKLESGKKKAHCQSWCVHGICNIDWYRHSITVAESVGTRNQVSGKLNASR